MRWQRQHSYEALCERMRAAGGLEADGGTGTVEVLLKLPDTSTVQGRFAEGTPAAALYALALGSPWAVAALPRGLRLSTLAPRRLVAPDEAISGSQFHRATVLVAEAEDAPGADGAPAVPAAQAPAAAGEPAAAAAPAAAGAAGGAAASPEDEQKVTAVANLTQVDRATARAALEAVAWETEAAVNRVLDGAAPSAAARPAAAAGAAAQAAARPFVQVQAGGGTLRAPADSIARVQAVMAQTGASREAAIGALQACGWEVEQGAQRVLAARTDTQAALRAGHEARQGQQGPGHGPGARVAAGAPTFQGSRSGSPISALACGAEGASQHLLAGAAWGALAALAVGVCAAFV